MGRARQSCRYMAPQGSNGQGQMLEVGQPGTSNTQPRGTGTRLPGETWGVRGPYSCKPRPQVRTWTRYEKCGWKNMSGAKTPAGPIRQYSGGGQSCRASGDIAGEARDHQKIYGLGWRLR